MNSGRRQIQFAISGSACRKLTKDQLKYLEKHWKKRVLKKLDVAERFVNQYVEYEYHHHRYEWCVICSPKRLSREKELKYKLFCKRITFETMSDKEINDIIFPERRKV